MAPSFRGYARLNFFIFKLNNQLTLNLLNFVLIAEIALFYY